VEKNLEEFLEKNLENGQALGKTITILINSRNRIIDQIKHAHDTSFGKKCYIPIDSIILGEILSLQEKSFNFCKQDKIFFL